MRSQSYQDVVTWFAIDKSPNCFFAEFVLEKLNQAEELILEYGHYGHTEGGGSCWKWSAPTSSILSLTLFKIVCTG